MSLANHGEETDRRLQETDQRLRASGQETDRRLDALIRTVDNLTRRNGPPRKSRS